MNAADKPGTDRPVAVLGTGIMGSAMARNLIVAGLRPKVWDRSQSATAQLSAAGAQAAASPAEAVSDAEVVITMLPNADAINSVIFADGVTDAFSQGAVKAQMGTIGVTATTDFRDSAGFNFGPDMMFVDAPVSGSKGPAEAGQLLILGVRSP